MDLTELDLKGLQQPQKFRLLQWLLNDLHQQGLLTSDTLMYIASDVMHLDYHEDEDLIGFSALDHEIAGE